jgi:diguanylate cyclase (GGDEF)-like protein
VVSPGRDDKDALIAQLMAENQALRAAVPSDTLSGLYTRRHFDERLTHEWLRAERFWTPLSLIAIDLDGIEPLHRRAGATAVRGVLGFVGELLRGNKRDVDIAGRVANTSFALILPATNRTGAEAEIARLRRLVGQRAPCDGIAFSFGMAVAFDEALTPLELLMLADEAALLDKRAGDHAHRTVPSSDRPTWIDAA